MFVHSFRAVVLVTLLPFIIALPQNFPPQSSTLPQSFTPQQSGGPSLESTPYGGSNVNGEPGNTNTNGGGNSGGPVTDNNPTNNNGPITNDGSQNNTNTAAPAANLALKPQSSSQGPTHMCGPDQKVILDGTPWLVANSMYGAGSMQGTSCTDYDSIDGSKVVWGNEVHIANVPDTENVCKGYANVALIQGLGNPISSIASIPADFTWSRTSTSPFKGNIVFDFILGPKGDSTSPAATELMLWLEWEADQLPIGWDAKPTSTIPNLFGTSWKIYEGISQGNGLLVRSALPDTKFNGAFKEDLKEWFEALVKLGKINEGIFVNIGNAGSEIFWGDSVLKSEIGFQINLA